MMDWNQNVRNAAVFMGGALFSLACLTACTDNVEVGNLAGHVAFVGPSEVSANAVVTWIGVSDPERDLVEVEFEVCNESGSSCDTRTVIGGTASLERVPTGHDFEQVSPRPVRWEPSCSDVEGDGPFTVRARVKGSDVPWVTSPATSLAELVSQEEQEPLCP